MPVFTFHCPPDLDARVEARGLLEIIRRDPGVLAATFRLLAGVWVLSIDTGPNAPGSWEGPVRRLCNVVEPPEEHALRDYGPPEEPVPLRERILREYLQFGGANRLAQTMAAPIRNRIDYVGTARRIFAVDELPQGALPVIAQDGVPFEQLPWSWVRPGCWVEFENGLIGKVVEVHHDSAVVRFSFWRSSEIHEEGLGSFSGKCKLIEGEPKEGLPWYERLDESL